MANHLLQDAVELYIKDKEKAHNLYTELAAGQSNTSQMFRDDETRRYREQRKKIKYAGMTSVM